MKNAYHRYHFFDKNVFYRCSENTIPYSLNNIQSLKPSKYVLNSLLDLHQKLKNYKFKLIKYLNNH